ncbi:MAG: restriction endonuclease [Porticoccaceae bacterium]|nr:restriction endonuclease [Porticoccaceae bacterium]
MFEHKYDDLFNPALQSLHELGGSGTNSEIENKVISLLNLSDEEINDIHRGNTTKLAYRLAWARNYLKRLGLLENSGRAVWALTSEGLRTESVDKELVKRIVKNIEETQKLSSQNIDDDENATEIELSWEERIVEILQSLHPSSFEILSQRLLRELGFTNVEVTGKSGDGGIDGVGVIKIGGVLSFHIVFQCKRYSGSVSSSHIRDFRGAMVGRTDKGLFITTGTFTRGAKVEASRDGAPPIDLIDGNEFATHLKDLKLGISVHLKEYVKIDHDWFENI